MNEANAPYKYDAFISYNHRDKDWVRDWLLPQLETAGLRVCIDFRDFEPGVPSLVNMENAVERSHKTLIVLTPAWVESEWTTFESLLIQTDDPAGRKARMIPLMLKPCKPPKRIAMLTYLDFTQPAEVDFQLRRLVAAINGEPMPTGPGSTLEMVREERSIEVPQVREAICRRFFSLFRATSVHARSLLQRLNSWWEWINQRLPAGYEMAFITLGIVILTWWRISQWYYSLDSAVRGGIIGCLIALVPFQVGFDKLSSCGKLQANLPVQRGE